MAVGLIKKQIIHSSEKSSPAKFLGNLFAGKGNLKKLKEAEKMYNEQMSAYKDFQFTNPYSKNVFANMENPFEDLTVNQKQADFQARQNQVGQANILDSLRSGGRFDAGNIQALANQAQLATQEASLSIGKQESQNQMLRAREASRLQTLERQGREGVQRGEAMVQGMEFDRQSTMLGMSMQQVGNAQQAIAANKAMWGNIIGGVASAFSGSTFNFGSSV
tara:strand:+ start:2477 stop:3136 length:660 start_codon:yes stop_codon:yes gene_type:complete